MYQYSFLWPGVSIRDGCVLVLQSSSSVTCTHYQCTPFLDHTLENVSLSRDILVKVNFRILAKLTKTQALPSALSSHRLFSLILVDTEPRVHDRELGAMSTRCVCGRPRMSMRWLRARDLSGPYRTRAPWHGTTTRLGSSVPDSYPTSAPGT